MAPGLAQPCGFGIWAAVGPSSRSPRRRRCRPPPRPAERLPGGALSLSRPRAHRKPPRSTDRTPEGLRTQGRVGVTDKRQPPLLQPQVPGSRAPPSCEFGLRTDEDPAPRPRRRPEVAGRAHPLLPRPRVLRVWRRPRRRVHALGWARSFRPFHSAPLLAALYTPKCRGPRASSAPQQFLSTE